MSALDQLDAAFRAGIADPEFSSRLVDLERDYTGRPSPSDARTQIWRAMRRCADLFQARGFESHRVSQDK